jgi:hypothetical protein
MPLYTSKNKKKLIISPKQRKGGKQIGLLKECFFYFLFECISVTSLGPLIWRALCMVVTLDQQATSEAAAKIRYFIYLTDD